MAPAASEAWPSPLSKRIHLSEVRTQVLRLARTRTHLSSEARASKIISPLLGPPIPSLEWKAVGLQRLTLSAVSNEGISKRAELGFKLCNGHVQALTRQRSNPDLYSRRYVLALPLFAGRQHHDVKIVS